MFEWLQPPQADSASVSPWLLLQRLVLALVFGLLVAEIYRRTRGPRGGGASFTATLVLLSILIAIVTQVIGDSVARAFSLVGALSIVRFRTVVQDTRDTAFVIFAVVIGMAVGASNLMVAVLGMVVVGLAAYLCRAKSPRFGGALGGALGGGGSAGSGGSKNGASGGAAGSPRKRTSELTIRMALGQTPEASVGPAVAAAAERYELESMETSRRGDAIDYVYRVQLREPKQAPTLVQELNRIAGVQSVQWKRAK